MEDFSIDGKMSVRVCGDDRKDPLSKEYWEEYFGAAIIQNREHTVLRKKIAELQTEAQELLIHRDDNLRKVFTGMEKAGLFPLENGIVDKDRRVIKPVFIFHDGLYEFEIRYPMKDGNTEVHVGHFKVQKLGR